MADKTSLEAETVEPFLIELDTGLRESFGGSFAVWSVCGEATCLLFDPALDRPEQAEPPQLSAEIEAAVVDVLGARQPRVVQTGSRLTLLLPIPKGEKGAVVATREFAESADISETWLLRLANCFIANFSSQTQLRGLRGEVRAYAWQMTESFEELTFLHTLAECLEIGDGAVNRWDTARSVMPFLRLAVRAESLVLVPADYSAVSPDEEPAIGMELIWDGAHAGGDSACRATVEQFRDQARLQPVVRNRRQGDSPAGKAMEGTSEIRDFVLTTIVRHGQVFGWLMAVNRTRHGSPHAGREPAPRWGLSDLEFGSAEAGLLVSAASVFAACARNVDLLHQKEHLLVGVVRSLVSAIEARDPYTFGHSERVALTAQRLGEQLGLDRQHCRRLYLAGLLHDIGKIGIADQLLCKPGKLTPSEEQRVKKHVEMGHAILRDLDQLNFVLPGVLHHHERFDGKGYPDCLAGQEIPLAARVIAVADAYDAMVTDRPYRTRLTDDQAEGQMRAGAATQFDPEILEAFFAAINEIRTISRAYQLPTSKRRLDRQYPTMSARESVDSDDVSDLVLSMIPPP
ncbi:MAG: HD-GYP domain-containing protein [Pirellulaceae bacterium]